jgi:uncharacterized protein
LIAAALALGLVTSLHCALMCGPLALAACRGGALRYFGGRLLSYTAIGALFGALGEHALCLLPVRSVQLVALAALAAAAFVRAATRLRRPRPPLVTVGTRPPRRLAARVLALLPRGAFTLGLATGLLPCGMLLPAWALAMASGGPASGALSMAAFAVASSPGLAAPLLGRRFLTRPAPRLEAAAWCALGVWLAVRPILVATGCH